MAQVLKMFRNAKERLQDDSCESLLWLVNFMPGLAGFSILKEKYSAIYWVVHVPLLLYVYGVGCFMYQAYDAVDTGDYIQSEVSVSLLVSIAYTSYWYWKERPVLVPLVNKVREADKLAFTTATETSRGKHKKSLHIIKIIILIFYISNYINATCIYWPNRMNLSNHYSLRPCVGMEPITATPNKQICQTILLIDEVGNATVTLNFQALLVFFISHTVLMYQLLSYEMLSLSTPEIYSKEHYNILVKRKLPMLIHRHVQLLDIVDNLKTLYSVPIGINFISNAVCMSLFFYLPLQAWLSFMPILVYCFVVFFLYCFLGQQLIDASEMFERAIYACGWESFEINEKKAVYMMLCQAQKPIEILAAGIIPVNISTFATTLQAMFKFVTVVKF